MIIIDSKLNGGISMRSLIRIIGLAILVGGIIVFSFGINSSRAVVEQGLEKVTGRYSGNTMWYIIGGIIMIVGGGSLAANAKRISRND